MLLFKKVEQLQQHLNTVRNDLRTIGFVPTMGALHQGHLSLIAEAAKQCDHVVCSIFVNPAQFNDNADLASYPRIPEKDIEALCNTSCDALLYPEVDEVYPKGWTSDAPTDFGYLTKTMEAVHRPGHFEGVAKVVKRLLDIVQPDKLFMGQKDFQQCAIVSEMVRMLELPVEVVCCPTIREKDGLAMSSRNLLLSEQEREKAPALFKSLLLARDLMDRLPVPEIEQKAMELQKIAGFQPEYFSIVDGHSLQAVSDPQQHDYIVACTAAKLGKVRLIDNLILRREFGGIKDS
ncbi:MAG: pantoate--beta-alanine ligase [Saprospiraceae bacterium]